MTARNHTENSSYVHPEDPRGYLKPDQPLLIDGLDWSWTFVYHKEIFGYPGYRIGEDGSFWSFHNRHFAPRCTEWRRIKGEKINGGYTMLYLSGPKGKTKVLLHVLLLSVFVGPRPLGLLSRHLNGNPEDNRLSNLRWGTQVENMADMKLHGNRHIGSRCVLSRLTEADVEEIRRRVLFGEMHIVVAKAFGVNRATISGIMRKQRWTHVNPDAIACEKMNVGSRNRVAKLDEEKIIEIRRLRESGLLYREIAEKYDVTISTIGCIFRGRNWKHVV